VQVGLMLGEHSTPAIPMSKVIAHELEILGSHGMQAHRYDAMFAMMAAGKLAPEQLIGRTINLEQSIDVLMNMDKFEVAGVTVVTEF
jgi:alcohol dehydrogenase